MTILLWCLNHYDWWIWLEASGEALVRTSQALHRGRVWRAAITRVPRNPGEHEYANFVASAQQQDASMNHNLILNHAQRSAWCMQPMWLWLEYHHKA